MVTFRQTPRRRLDGIGQVQNDHNPWRLLVQFAARRVRVEGNPDNARLSRKMLAIPSSPHDAHKCASSSGGSEGMAEP
jgi:hypothetical protein